MTRRAWLLTGIGSVVGLALLLVIAGIATALGMTGGTGLGGRSVTERDLSPTEQVRAINTYVPQPIPPDATDIHLRYQHFQDTFFEATFTLPPASFSAYVQQLTPVPTIINGTTPAKYQGVAIGSYTSSIIADPATYRITVSYVTT